MLATITTEAASKYSPLGDMQRGFLERGVVEEVTPYCQVVRHSQSRSLMIRFGVPWDVTVDIEDPEVVRGCNPASWLDPQRIIDEYLHAPGSLESDFRRYHLNQLVEDAGGEGVPADMWDACVDASAPRLVDGQDVVIAIDAGYRKDCSAVVTAGLLPDGRARFDAMIWRPAREQGLELDLEATVEQFVNEQLERYRVTRIVCDPMLMNQSMQRWGQRVGSQIVREYRFGWGDTGPDSVTLLGAIQSRRLVHDGDPVLRRHVLNMRARYGPNGAWRWDDHPDKKRDDSEVPNDAGIALMMAAGELLGGEPQNQYGARGLIIA
jgi:phage terminase large subunit-like protein